MISKVFISTVLLSVLSISTFARGDSTEGQKCRPLGPLRADDKVDLIARCHCESAAFMAASAMTLAESKGYFPVDIRDWKNMETNIEERRMVVWLTPESYFLTLVESKKSGDKVVERYNFYQASDGESVEQFKLSEVTILASVYNDGSARCNIMNVSTQ